MKKNLLFFGAFIFFLVISFSVTHSFFSDAATSTSNTFAAAEVFPTATVSATPVLSISPTPSPLTAGIFDSNDYTCSGGAVNQTTQLGNVSITVLPSDLSLTVTLTGATPNSSYDIWVNQDPGSCPLNAPSFPGGVTTDNSGNGSNTFTIAKTGGATRYWVSAVGGNQVLRSIAQP